MIGILHHGIVPLDWARKFYSLQRPGQTLYVYSSTLPYDASRNAACEAAIQHNVEWLLFLDSDLVPDRDDAIAALMRHNLPVVSGVYHSKAPPHLPLVLRRMPQAQPDGTVKSVLAAISDWTPGEVLQVDAVPTGLLLIHRRVLQKFKDEGEPVFRWTMGRAVRMRDQFKLSDADLAALAAHLDRVPSADPAAAPYRRVLDRIRNEPEVEGLSEDFDASVRMKEFGFPLHVDTSVMAAHVTSMRIIPSPTGGPGRYAWMETP